MATAAEEHAVTSRELLTKALEAVAQDDLLQASEKGWGAAAHLVKGLAEKRGWQHGGHRQLYQTVNRLAQEASDREIRILFNSASALHTNFYENWMPREMVEESMLQVKEFLDKLEGLA